MGTGLLGGDHVLQLGVRALRALPRPVPTPEEAAAEAAHPVRQGFAAPAPVPARGLQAGIGAALTALGAALLLEPLLP
ncbi:hypothetical protein [Streptomyces sp. NPDC007205]|uniref:hypothetical protein n=1 Tax=Streptomyces sp. NPDC007205 TaxID=3154316 RepID=UPI0033F968C1